MKTDQLKDSKETLLVQYLAMYLRSYVACLSFAEYCHSYKVWGIKKYQSNRGCYDIVLLTKLRQILDKVFHAPWSMLSIFL